MSSLSQRLIELRCNNFLHGILDGDIVEIKCRKPYCRPSPGVVVLHRFSTLTGELVETLYFRDPEEK
jgi:hypothetical protein